MNNPKEIIRELVAAGIDPHVLYLCQRLVGFTDQEWDWAISEQIKEEQYFEEVERQWEATFPSKQEREKIFGFSPEKIERYRRRYILDRYEELTRASDESKLKAKLAGEYRYRFENKGLSPDDIEQAHCVEIGKLIEVKTGFVLCPFHNEKSPSLHITKNKFYCFGCGEYGDAIEFVMKTKNFNFKQAVSYLINL